MFSVQNLQINRGSTTANAQGNLTTVNHTYKDKSSTLANILLNFPPYLGQGVNQDLIKVGDTIVINGSDGVRMSEILALSPFTVGPDLFMESAPTLSVGAPIVAVDTNAAKITGTTLQMEIADVSHPGIVNASPQVFGGLKTFNSGLLTNTIDTINATTLNVGTTNATGIILDKNTTVTATHAFYANILDTVTSVPMLIAPSFATHVTVNPVTDFNNGIQFPATGPFIRILNYYGYNEFSTTFNNQGNETSNITILIVKIGKLVTMVFESGATGIGGTDPFFISDIHVPFDFYPSADAQGFWRVFDGGTYFTGMIFISTTTGLITIYRDPNQTTGFSGNGGFDIGSFSYMTG